MARLRLCKVNVRLGTPASASSFLASSRDFLMSFEKPGSLTSSDFGVANGEPGRIRPPTARSVEMRDRPWLPPQRSIAMQSARRIRTSSNGFFSTLKQTRRLSVQLDSLDPNFVSHRLHQPVATVARRDGASRLRDRTNHSCSIANYTNSDRRNQTTDRYRRAAPFQSGEHHSSAGRATSAHATSFTQVQLQGCSPPGTQASTIFASVLTSYSLRRSAPRIVISAFSYREKGGR